MTTPSKPESRTGKHTANILKKALAAFGPNGENWVKGWKAVDAPKCCVTTSFNRIRPEPSPAVIEKAYDLLSAATRSNLLLEEWNDARCRKFAQVKALFKRAIALAEGRNA